MVRNGTMMRSRNGAMPKKPRMSAWPFTNSGPKNSAPDRITYNDTTRYAMGESKYDASSRLAIAAMLLMTTLPSLAPSGRGVSAGADLPSLAPSGRAVSAGDDLPSFDALWARRVGGSRPPGAG